jgi:hypothetical protein
MHDAPAGVASSAIGAVLDTSAKPPVLMSYYHVRDHQGC